MFLTRNAISRSFVFYYLHVSNLITDAFEIAPYSPENILDFGLLMIHAFIN